MIFRHCEEAKPTRQSMPEKKPEKSGLLRFARKDFLVCAIIGCALLALSACGHKGKLKTPTEAAADAQKKAREQERREQREEKREEKSREKSEDGSF